MKVLLAVTLSLTLAGEGFSQVTTILCSPAVCVTLPPPNLNPTPMPTPSVQATPTATPTALAAPAPTQAMRPEPSRVKAIVLTAAVSAAGTWLVVKLFKRGKRK